MTVISNTTVISNFGSIGQLDLLHHLYSTIHISTEVYEEIQTGQEEGYRFYADIDQHIHPFAADGWIHLISMANEQELQLFGKLSSRLHRGEASCLAIAQQRHWSLLTDDRAARNEALNLDIRVSGTLGCLVLMVERDLYTLEQTNIWLTEMIRQGYWSPVTDLTGLIKR
jgi:predicted nucleic acid-binding protein